MAWQRLGRIWCMAWPQNGRGKFCVCKRLYLAILTTIKVVVQVLVVCHDCLSDDFWSPIMHFQGHQIPSTSNTIRTRVRMIFLLQDLDYLLDKSASPRNTMIIDISYWPFYCFSLQHIMKSSSSRKRWKLPTGDRFKKYID
jgi:hypothetical protein